MHTGDETDGGCAETERLLDNQSSVRPVPPDRFNAVLIVFFILGIGTLLPWNFFINAKLYFIYKLRDTNISSDEAWSNTSYYTDQQKIFLNEIEIAAMVPGIIFQFLNIGLAQLFSWKSRIYMSLSTMIVLFLLTIIFTRLPTDAYQSAFSAVTLMSIAILNAAGSILQGGAFGLACYFPRRYMQSLMSGGAMAGLVSSIANVLTLLFGSTPEQSGFGYFLIAELAIIVTLIAFVIFLFLDFAKHCISHQIRQENVEYSVNQTRNRSNSSSSSDIPSIVDDATSTPITVVKKPALWTIIKQIWVEAMAVFLIFFVTLLCFPSLNSSIQSVEEQPTSWTSVYFVPVTCFVLFNACDLLGRAMVGVFQWPSESHRFLLVICSVLRVGFIPIFMFCNIQPRVKLPVYFKNDWVPPVALSVFALTNGYFGTLCMIYGPRRVDAVNAELAGVIMSFFLSIGLGCGAVMSFLLIKIV